MRKASLFLRTLGAAFLASLPLFTSVACAKLTAPAREESVPATVSATAARPAASPAPTPSPRATAPAGQSATVTAAHILIAYEGAMRSKSTRSKDEAAKLAAKLAAQAKGGADFAELAKKHSDGPSASRGGKLRAFSRRQMVKPFSDATFALKVGQVSNPVETPFGYHVIKRTK